MLYEYLSALGLIFIAEMGDKTQIMAMTFATKYKMKFILLGVMIGAFLNHGLAIMLGSLLNQYVPLDFLQLVAGFMFIGFGFMSLSVDDEEVEDKVSKYGPVLTVALAFFIGELGDKTQLAALTLSAGAAHPFIILMGTVSGMVLTSLLGILVGIKLGSKIPEFQLKIGAFAVFLFFGLEKIINSPYRVQVNSLWVILFLVAIAGISIIRLRGFKKAYKALETTTYQRRAEILREYMSKISQSTDELCLGEEVCGSCDGTICAVGYLKELIAEGIANNGHIDENRIKSVDQLTLKSFDKNKAKYILGLVVDYYKLFPTEFKDNKMLEAVREQLEIIIYGKSYVEDADVDHYIDWYERQ